MSAISFFVKNVVFGMLALLMMSLDAEDINSEHERSIPQPEVETPVTELPNY